MSIPRKSSAAPRPAILRDGIANIPLGVNAKYGYAKVDPEYAHLSEGLWNLNGRYVVGRYKGRRAVLHRLILAPKDGYEIDHINRDTLDNRLSNLRYATRSQNAANRRHKPGMYSSYKGVTYDKSRKKWSAVIMKGGVSITIGRYDDELSAAKAYNERATSIYGEFATLNEV